MVTPDPGRASNCGLPLITPQPFPDRIGHVSAPTTWPGHPIECLDQVRGEQEIRAHTHAHSIAHGVSSRNGAQARV